MSPPPLSGSGGAFHADVLWALELLRLFTRADKIIGIGPG